MLKPFKNRKIDYDKPVYVYRNLNCRGVSYSLKQDGLVVAHGLNFKLKDCEFKVSKAGQKRARKEGKRNVHAYVRGFISIPNTNKIKAVNKIAYNPFKTDTFLVKENNMPIYNSKSVAFMLCGVYASI